MSTLPDTVDLLAVTTGPHDRTLAALEDPDSGALAAVAWCSGHLAGADCVLYRAAQRHAKNGRQRVRALRAVDHALQQALCRLDRRLTGDVHLVGVPVEAIAQQVKELLRAHADGERRLVGSLQAALGPAEQQELAEALLAATLDAPSRPHPHTRHTPLSSLVARIDAAVDRVRDTMDNRVVPTGHPPRGARPSGRWACYLMGVPYPQDEQVRAP
jgi:hypothetical protein